MSELETQSAEEKKMSSECLEMSKAESLIVEFFNNANSVQVEEGTWYYSESSVEAELLEVYAKLAKAKEDYKALFSAFESCQDELKKANERARELEEVNLELAANVEACCELTDMDMGAAIERLFEIDNTESKALLNKFAIEKKQEAILTIKDKWIKKASEMPLQLECRSKGSSCYNWAMFYARELTDEAEQLRKEQE